MKAISVRACPVRDGSVTWIDPLTFGRKTPPKRLDFHVYSGITGIALFLAAAARYLDGANEAEDLARRSIEPLRDQLRRLAESPDRAAQLEIPLGGIRGLGGYIYTLARLGDFLADASLLEEALAVAGLITPERIASDRGLDVFVGSAGAVLALLTLDQLLDSAEPAVLDAALACGEHLESEAIESDDAVLWRAKGKPSYCGWAHGAAGIAHALGRLATRSDREHFLDTAHRGLRFERRYFDLDERNWRDLRFQDEVSFITALCHGAPGIALARFDFPRAERDPAIAQEIQDALRTTAEAEEAALDFVCCGNIGRAEILFEGARHGAREGLEAAAAIVQRTLERAQADDDNFRYFEEPYEDRFSPSFYSGAAGIGYSLLRMSSDADLPCVLRMD